MTLTRETIERLEQLGTGPYTAEALAEYQKLLLDNGKELIAAARAEVSRERSGPRLVTEGPLPKGRAILVHGPVGVWGVVHTGLSSRDADACRSIGYKFYDMGPLPQPIVREVE